MTSGILRRRSTGALLALVVLASAIAGCAEATDHSSGPANQPSVSPTAGPGGVSQTPWPTPSIATPSPSATHRSPTANHHHPTKRAQQLRPGDTGPAVLALQQQLSALGYWLGRPDGNFGDSTEQAVYALQKAAGLTRDGVVGAHTARALSKGVLPVPRTTQGDAIEVDLKADLVMVVRNGALTHVLNTSTGGGYTYTENGVSAVAQTPTGTFHVLPPGRRPRDRPARPAVATEVLQRRFRDPR